jgi:urocanate hydratase
MDGKTHRSTRRFTGAALERLLTLTASDKPATETATPSALDFVLQVERRFAALIQAAPDAQSLGGKLIYIGDLDDEGRAWMVAANIAGGATLGASADAAAQKQAIRDGVADFLVTDLDEALRILKNEIRKHETVAVCVGQALEAVEREMRERGVVPDLLPRLGIAQAGEQKALLHWSVASAPAQALPKLDAIAMECVEADAAALRWLRLAPRYLGRAARNLRLLRCTNAEAEGFVARVREAVKGGVIGLEVRIALNGVETCLRKPPAQSR